MRDTASAARRAKDGVQIGTQPKAHREVKVVQLELYRAERVVLAVRRRLSELQCAHVQAKLDAGNLLRELAALQREVRACRARMVQGGMLERDRDVAGSPPGRVQPSPGSTSGLSGSTTIS